MNEKYIRYKEAAGIGVHHKSLVRIAPLVFLYSRTEFSSESFADTIKFLL